MPVDDRDAVLTTFTSFLPELVLHGGAFTAVDRCETEVDAAFAANAMGTRHIAEAAALAGAHVVYVSTDYVFDGTGSRPPTGSGTPRARPRSMAPPSWRANASAGPVSTIVRTSWLCGAHGANMVVTALHLASGEGELQFVDDQHGSPDLHC